MPHSEQHRTDPHASGEDATPGSGESREPSESPAVGIADGPTVVGIGASAGGLAALRALFENVPEGSGVAWVIVVHLSPEHESHLAELLQPHTGIPIQQVTETVALEPDRVYVIPPGANLDAIDTHLRLTALEEKRRERAPIDHFFRTLAQTHDGRAVGVILTGTGSDGTLGIKELKGNNGLTIVQDPAEAEYDSMPQSAIATGLVDLVLPLEEIPAAVVRFARTHPRVPIPDAGGDLAEERQRILHEVFAQIRARTNRDFSRYKRSTILRRIARRMQLASIEEFPAYLELLRTNPTEVHALADDLLITVTNFFRDPEAFETLATDAIPRLFEAKDPGDEVRVWSVGCASGEEAYSLAMLLLEEAARRGAPPRIQVFASDLHEPSLKKAREGFYPGAIESDVSAERLKRFFVKEDGGYRVRKEVRDLVVFAPHNLMGDPPFSKIDLLSCRNLLIYLQRDVQRDVIELFHYALNPDGFLLLGTSETLEAGELFQLLDKQHCLYRKRNVPAPEPRLPVFPLTHPRFPMGPPESEQPDAPDGSVALGALHREMLEPYVPPSILMTPDNRAVHYAGRAGRYLHHPSGEATQNVFRLVREELRIELRAAIHAAREQRIPVRSKPVRVRFNGETGMVTLNVSPSLPPQQTGYLLVIFEERPTHAAEPGESREASADRSELEVELERAKRQLQVMIEEDEGSREELRASNEELQSANEELRSTMEELETSKEELQSMNEELQTVNQENRHKVEELAQLTSDLSNLLAATDIATLFLDRELRILRFTPQIAELFNVRGMDRGRPLADFTHRLGYTDILDDSRQVLKTLVPIEREARTDDDRWFLTRVRPYRSEDDRIEGVVITFVDITSRKHAEEDLRRSEERYRLLVQGAQEYAIFTLDPEGRITSWNTGAERIFGHTEREALGRDVAVIFTEEDRAEGVPEAEMAAAAQEGRATDERWHLRKDGGRFWASGVMEVLRTAGGELRGFVKLLRDNTERKRAEEDLRQLNETLEERVVERTRQVRELVSTLSFAEQRERSRIAHVLHDGIQQLLHALNIRCDMLARERDPEKLQELLAVTKELLRQAVRATRTLTAEIDPPVLHTEDFAEALAWLASHMREQHALAVELDLDLDAAEPLSEGKRIMLFHSVRELLFNVVKHARVNEAHVSAFVREERIVIEMGDHGAGFDPATANGEKQRSFGLANLRERLQLSGGSLEIESRPGEGTRVRLTLPLDM